MSISDRRVHIRIRLIQGGKFRQESIHALRRAHIDERLHRLGAVLRELTDTETVIVTALQIELHHQHMAVVQPAEIIVVVPLRNVAQQADVAVNADVDGILCAADNLVSEVGTGGAFS